VIPSFATAFLVGLLGGAHCLGMCGGIVVTLSLGLSRGPGAPLPLLLGYNLGRIAGYGLLGALFGGVGALALVPLPGAQRALYFVAALIMILLGLYLGGWWSILARIERLGMPLWRRLEPWARRQLPLRHGYQAVFVGLIWAGLPCGLTYSLLISALATGSAAQGAGLMLAFGLGTLPNLLGIGLLVGAAARYTAARWARHLSGAIILGCGLHALWRSVHA